jgi:hypothetical protein
MKYQDSHPSDQQLLLEMEGELAPHDEKQVRAHLEECWKCRARRQELDGAITDFVRVYQRDFDTKLPPASGPRAWLKAQISQLPAGPRGILFNLPPGVAWATLAAAFGLLTVAAFLVWAGLHSRSQAIVVSVPDSKLTPGAALLATRQAVCSETIPKNKTVPVALQRKVFEEYGIAGNESRAYEVDYLITPALGGAEDIHNLWPQSYSATAWNAQVKDALEDRLREMVCDGSLDLTEAQREIAADWIAAYKKYFHTEKPLPEHTP